MIDENNTKIGIIGLGYVGLPLAVEFGKVFETIGFDINKSRINELIQSNDSTLEVATNELKEANKLRYTTNLEELKYCNIFIVTVPTPIDEANKPDLTSLIKASKAVGKLLKIDDVVIYESTVYPGATEEICIPFLEEKSNLKFNKDFYCGYSPERINPGDKKHRLVNIKKVVSGSNEDVTEKINELYKKIIVAGTYKAESIRIAEAAKVIENTQRDVNIALINELALIFNKLNIDTEAVLEAAGSKWNFLPFKPGLVGGHCIGVDPYYLTYKAIDVGYTPEIILAGRRLNDNMGNFIANQVISLMTKKRIQPIDANVLIMGLSFKENCPDIRNTRVIDLVNEFEDLNCNVDVYDPWVDKEKANQEYGISLVETPVKAKYEAVILAVAHDEFKLLTLEKIKKYAKANYVLFDVKYILKANEVDGRL